MKTILLILLCTLSLSCSNDIDIEFEPYFNQYHYTDWHTGQDEVLTVRGYEDGTTLISGIDSNCIAYIVFGNIDIPLSNRLYNITNSYDTFNADYVVLEWYLLGTKELIFKQ